MSPLYTPDALERTLTMPPFHSRLHVSAWVLVQPLSSIRPTDASLFCSPEKAIHYRSTWIAVIVSMVFVSCASLLLRYIMIRENGKRDALLKVDAAAAVPPSRDQPEVSKAKSLEGLHVPEVTDPNLYAFADLTDKEQPGFRYSL